MSLSHNSRNATCLTSIPSHNSMDTFWATTQGTPASRPSRYHQSFVDHACPQQSKHNFWLCNITWCCSWATRQNLLPGRLAGTRAARCQTPLMPFSIGLAWRDNPHRQVPLASKPTMIVVIAWWVTYYRQALHQYTCITSFGTTTLLVSSIQTSHIQ